MSDDRTNQAIASALQHLLQWDSLPWADRARTFREYLNGAGYHIVPVLAAVRPSAVKAAREEGRVAGRAAMAGELADVIAPDIARVHGLRIEPAPVGPRGCRHNQTTHDTAGQLCVVCGARRRPGSEVWV